MNKVTNNIAFYIIVFFLTILILIGGYFSYKIFLAPPESVDLSVLAIDQEFQDILDQMEKDRLERLQNKEINYVEYTEPSCYIDGVEYPDGSKKVFYSRLVVGLYESCSKYAITKTCDASFWLGDKNYKYTTCSRLLDCKLPDNSILKNGKSIEMFAKKNVSYGDNCEKYKGIRKCVETKLTGDDRYQYLKCEISKAGTCKIESGDGESHLIPNNKAEIFYSVSAVPYNDNCALYAQKRICSEGTLYGDKDFSFLECKKEVPKDCYVDDVTIKHGSSRVLYSREQSYKLKTCKFYAQIRECKNGELSGESGYSYASCEDV